MISKSAPRLGPVREDEGRRQEVVIPVHVGIMNENDLRGIKIFVEQVTKLKEKIRSVMPTVGKKKEWVKSRK